MIQMTDFLHSFARKLYSIFICLVDFDWCGLGFLKPEHPLVPRQAVRSHIAPHFSSLFLHFKKWWLCKNVIFDKHIWIPASKQMPSLRSHHVGTTYVELGELFLFQFGNDTRRTVYKTYSHSMPVPQMVWSCCVLRSWSSGKSVFRTNGNFPLTSSHVSLPFLYFMNISLLYIRHYSHVFT